MLIVKADNEGLKLAAAFLKADKIVVYPTDTSYGLAANAGSLKAVKKLYKIKEREGKKPIHVTVDSLEMARRLVKFDRRAIRFYKYFLPGPLTMVLPLKSSLESIKYLSAKTGTLGVRQPKNRIAIELCRRSGCPITATSANPSGYLSGGKDSYSAGEIVKQFFGKKNVPDLILDAGPLKRHQPSTIVDLSKARVKILREGPVKLKVINLFLDKYAKRK